MKESCDHPGCVLPAIHWTCDGEECGTVRGADGVLRMLYRDTAQHAWCESHSRPVREKRRDGTVIEITFGAEGRFIETPVLGD